MIYYIVAALLIGISAAPRSDARRLATCLMAIVLIILGGLRLQVGTDWDSYQEVFDLVRQGYKFSELREENGFLTLVFLFQKISDSYAAFVLILFTLSFCLKLYAAHRFGVDLAVSMAVYFFSVFLIYDINGLRQGLAMGFVLCAGWYAVQSRIWPFLTAMVLAISVHTVALVALPIYWLANGLQFGRQPIYLRYLAALLAITIAYVLSLAIADTDASVYLELVNLTDRYNHYIDNFDKQFSLLSLGSVQRVFILGLALYMQPQFRCTPRTASLLVNTYLAATFIFFLLSFNIEFMARVSYYYKIFDMILISVMFRSLKDSLSIGLFILLLGVLCFGSISQLLSIPDGGLLPYRSQLSG